MSKKIIAVIAVVTILFVCVFAACGKDEGIYIKNKDIDNLVTDENGEKLLGSSGEILVYATDHDGDYITNADGTYETLAQEFQPIEEDGVVEDFGFKFTIPKDWKSTNSFGVFEKKDGTQNLSIGVAEYTYKDYYNHNKKFYQDLKGQPGLKEIIWNENVDLGKDFTNVCRFVITTDEGTRVLYFFSNNQNVYKIIFNTADTANAIADSEALCKAITFKPYVYYPDVTSVVTTVKVATTEPTTVAE